MTVQTVIAEVIQEPETGYWFVMRHYEGGQEERIGPLTSRAKAEAEVVDMVNEAARLNILFPNQRMIYRVEAK